MSRYQQKPIELHGLRTVSIHERGGKVRTDHFSRPYKPGEGMLGLLDSLPRLLAADSLRAVVHAMIQARRRYKPIIWGIGGHVVKCGLAPVFIRMMDKRWATAFAMNGSAAIHDFEIAIAGCTSEDVEAVLPDGRFGSAHETGFDMNTAIHDGAVDGLGVGESLGRRLMATAHPRFVDRSLLAMAYRKTIPVTVHVAVGTDTPHTHPAVDPGALGEATHRDFRLFATLVSELHEGGVYINLGSAVIMPEVFLKAVSLVRNLGHRLTNFTTVNFDFIQHYRPKVNVVERPHAGAGGRGYSITGHHEILVPLLAAVLAECEE